MGKANKDKPFKEDDAKAYGYGIGHYFSVKKKAGRPPKNSKGAGRPAQNNRKSPPPAAKASAPAVDNNDVSNAEEEEEEEDDEEDFEEEEEEDDETERPKQKKSRTNWGAPENRAKMEKAINDYLKREGDAIDNNGEFIADRQLYAGLVGIPYNSIYKYIHPNEEKRKKLGNGRRGRPRLVEDDQCQFVAETLARMDRCNDGASRKEAVDLVQDVEPKLSREQAARQLSRTILPKGHANGILKQKLQKVQATTSDRIAISLPQQFRWHTLIDNEFKFLRENNTGVCPKTGKSFGELMAHFIAGLDEMCIMSDQHGSLKVIGSADKKKHEKLLQDGRTSITIVRTGTTAGTTGPTIFLLKGKKKRKQFTDAFLEKHGLAPGSTIIMTENAFMTDEAWLEVSKAIVKGYRSLPYIKDNPNWYMLELLDGFKSHENVFAANELRVEARIREVKEESNTSHVCQGYDQHVAREDKKNASESLYDARKIQQQQTAKATIDQYDLVLVGIRIVKQCKPETWVASFRRVNLHPEFRVGFVEYTKKISQYLRGGTQFVEEDLYPSPWKKFQMLPSFWKGMEPNERRVAMTILRTNGGKYTTQCLKALRKECKLNLAQLTDIRVCIIIAQEHPETLEMTPDMKPPAAPDNSTNEASIATIEEARTEEQNLNTGLDFYQLHPKDSAGKPKFDGEELLEHMCGFRNREFAAKSISLDDGSDKSPPKLLPSKHLDVHLYNDNIRSIKPPTKDFLRGNAMSHAHGVKAQRKMAERKLTNLGTIVGHSGVVNSAENMERMRLNMEFAASFADIKRATEHEKKQKEREAMKELEKNAPKAAKKLEKKERKVVSLTVPEISAILFMAYNVEVQGAKSKLRKIDYVNMLEKEMTKDIGKYEAFLLSLTADNVPVVAGTGTASTSASTSTSPQVDNNGPASDCNHASTMEAEVNSDDHLLEEEERGQGNRKRKAASRPSM